MFKLEKVSAYALAQPFTVAMTLLGFVMGILYSGLGAVYDILNSQLGFGTILAFFALIGMPLMFGIVGFCAGIIGAILNNLAVDLFGKS